jgi:hypothetical protein
MRTDAERAALRDLVRRGYDAVSQAYRSDDGQSNANSAETTAAPPTHSRSRRRTSADLP